MVNCWRAILAWGGRLFFAGVAIALAPVPSAFAAEQAGPSTPARAGFVTVLDVRYTETPGADAKSQSLDIYSPKGAEGRPVMAFIHGGGWSRGDKGNVGAKPGFFAGEGWVFVSINYRLLPAGKHPANVEDVARALAWVHDNIARHGGDPGKLFVMGHSAGAHLAALVATDGRRLDAAGKSLGIIRGAIPLDTSVYDLPALMEGGAGSFYGKMFGDDPGLWRDASPAHHITKDKKLPPFLIFYSRGMGVAQEKEIRAAQADAFAKRLREAGASAEVVSATDQTHGEINQQFGTLGDRVTLRSMEFLSSLVRK